jgi:hypothetical protein
MDERAIWDIEQKSFCKHALAQGPEGRTVRVCFDDPVRLAKDSGVGTKVVVCASERAWNRHDSEGHTRKCVPQWMFIGR